MRAHSPVPMLCILYGMRLASLLHRMPRICSLSWLWRPVVARQGAFSTLCSIFSQWYHLLFILSSFQSASSVCRMTRCLGKYVHEHWELGQCVYGGWSGAGLSGVVSLWACVFLNWQEHPLESKFTLRCDLQLHERRVCVNYFQRIDLVMVFSLYMWF